MKRITTLIGIGALMIGASYEMAAAEAAGFPSSTGMQCSVCSFSFDYETLVITTDLHCAETPVGSAWCYVFDWFAPDLVSCDNGGECPMWEEEEEASALLATDLIARMTATQEGTWVVGHGCSTTGPAAGLERGETLR
jgi:hypothetical protein